MRSLFSFCNKFSLNKIEYRYIVAAIYAVVLFLDRLDLTIVNIALPTLSTHFNVPITQTEWVNNAYLMALAISIPLSTWLGERFGNKRVFIFSIGMFGLASLLCGFSPNLTLMAIFRFLQGLGGGVIVPVGMTMVYKVFEPKEYASITSFIFIPTLIAPAISPALGGVMIHYLGWQWVFFFAVPICIIAVILSILKIVEQKHEVKNPLDWQGFLFSSCALVCILYFLSSLGQNANHLRTFGVLLVAIFFIFQFVRCEKRHKFPLIDLAFFKNKVFVYANLIQLAFQISHFGSIFLIGVYLQLSAGMSAMTAGLIMGAQSVGAICMSRYSVKLFHRFGPGFPIMIGLMGNAVITPCIMLIDNSKMIVAGVLLMFIRGLFTGLCGAPVQTLSIIGVSKQDVGRASAIFNASRQIAISIGIALTSLLIAYGLKNNSALPHGKSVFYTAFMLIPFVCCFGIYIAKKVQNKKIISLINKDSLF